MYKLKSLTEHINEDWFRNAHNYMMLSNDERVKWMLATWPKMNKSKIKKYSNTEWTKLPVDPFKHSDTNVPYPDNPIFNTNERLNATQDVTHLFKNHETKVNSLYETLDAQISHGDIEAVMVYEFFGLGNLLKGIFVNPFIKRKISKLTDELIRIRVEIAKLGLSSDMNDFEERNEYDSDEYSPRQTGKKANSSYRGGGKGDEQDVVNAKQIEALEDSALALEAKMDILAGDDERLERYITLQKIEARLKANELIIKMANGEQKKILQKYNKAVIKDAKAIADELDEHNLWLSTEGAQGLNESKLSATGAQMMVSYLDKYHPLMALMKWKEELVKAPYKLSKDNAKLVANKVYDKRGTTNNNHLKQIAQQELKKFIHESLNEDDNRPDSVIGREKYQDLITKSNEEAAKARELEGSGEEAKAAIARLNSEIARRKAAILGLTIKLKNLKTRL